MTTRVVEFSSDGAAAQAAAAYRQIISSGTSLLDERRPWAELFDGVSIGGDDNFVIAVAEDQRFDLCYDSPLSWANETVAQLD